MKTLNQLGMSLTEMLISLAISMVVIGGVVSIYGSTVGSSSTTLKSSKLNQELTAVLSVMANDIRRAGYDGGPDYTSPQDNPFSQVNSTALEVQGGNCIVYTYDANNSGGNAPDASEVVGFRLSGGVIQMRQQGDPASANDCVDADASDTWLSVTDGAIINITGLSFDLSASQCLNTSQPDGVDDDGDSVADNAEEYDCYTSVPANGSGVVTVETRQVAITIDGALVNDDANNPVTASVSQIVRVRNDLVRVR